MLHDVYTTTLVKLQHVKFGGSFNTWSSYSFPFNWIGVGGVGIVAVYATTRDSYNAVYDSTGFDISVTQVSTVTVGKLQRHTVLHKEPA